MSKTQCTGSGQRAIYYQGNIHPHCPVCKADLSVQGKHKKVVAGVVGKHYGSWRSKP